MHQAGLVGRIHPQHHQHREASIETTLCPSKAVRTPVKRLTIVRAEECKADYVAWCLSYEIMHEKNVAQRL